MGSPTRARVEAGLTALVREHRFTIAVVFPLVGAGLFVAGHEGWLPSRLATHPGLILAGTAVMRLPLIAALAPLVDRRAAAALTAATAYSYLVESVGVRYGVPYGEFGYGTDLGPMVAGVPVGLPLFFLPLVVDAVLLCLVSFPRAGRLARGVGAVVVLVAVDGVLDPAAVGLGFWAYEAHGGYYGVPASNFVGWTLSGLVAVSLVTAGFDREALSARVADCEFALDDLVSFVVLWGVTNAYFGHWIAVALAGGLAAGLVRTDRVDFASVGPGVGGD